MGFYYHGTNLQGALGIAKQGAILSPWDIEILRFQAAVAEGKDLNLKEGETIEDVALRISSRGFSPFDIEHRVKSVSISRTLHVPRGHAAAAEKQGLGGVVLGFELSDSLIPYIYRKSTHVFIPRRVPIDGLREIHVMDSLGKINKNARGFEELKKAFKRYSPCYVYAGYSGF